MRGTMCQCSPVARHEGESWSPEFPVRVPQESHLVPPLSRSGPPKLPSGSPRSPTRVPRFTRLPRSSTVLDAKVTPPNRKGNQFKFNPTSNRQRCWCWRMLGRGTEATARSTGAGRLPVPMVSRRLPCRDASPAELPVRGSRLATRSGHGASRSPAFPASGSQSCISPMPPRCTPARTWARMPEERRHIAHAEPERLEGGARMGRCGSSPAVPGWVASGETGGPTRWIARSPILPAWHLDAGRLATPIPRVAATAHDSSAVRSGTVPRAHNSGWSGAGPASSPLRCAPMQLQMPRTRPPGRWIGSGRRGRHPRAGVDARGNGVTRRGERRPERTFRCRGGSGTRRRAMWVIYGTDGSRWAVGPPKWEARGTTARMHRPMP
jgi:hypothetical protein